MTSPPETNPQKNGPGATGPEAQPAEDPHPAGGPLRWAETPVETKPSLARRAGRIGATVLIFALALLGALLIWSYYITSPWTRDGRVRVQVANVAPQVSGQITQIRIVDNQFVKKGEVLYVIDPFDFQVKLNSAKASVKQEAADYQVKKIQAERLLKLNDLASFQQAQQSQDQAEINLQRTQVRSPVNGFVTNLLMRVGDYASAGTANVSVIDTDSYWIDGYFEETKLGRICVGDRAEAQLMGFSPPVVGEIDTITRGISVSNATPSTQGLPSVNAVYTWVRLAQRVPVRIRIVEVPPGVPLVSGLTATVTVRNTRPGAAGPSDSLVARVRDVFVAPPPSPDCIPPTKGGSGPPESIPASEAGPAKTPAELAPGLADGVRGRPRGP